MTTRKNTGTRVTAAAGLVAVCLATMPAHAASLLIDAFSTDQGPLSVSPLGPTSDASSAAGSGIIGGERDLVLTTDPGVSPFSSNAQVAAGVAQLADNSQFQSDLLFQWDGTDGDPNSLDATGLGGVDLTSGGNNAFEIGLTFDDLPATLQMTVHSDGANASTVTFPGTGLIFTDVAIYIPFELFMGSADMTSVGAIELLISSPTNGLDISFDYIQTGIAPVPLPGAFWLLAGAFFSFGLTRRR